MRKILIIVILFISFNVWASPINKKYSFKNFTNMVMTDADVIELNNSEIVGSCFYQEGVTNRHIFPENMEGVTFVRCNLDNVYIDEIKNTIIKEGNDACTHKNILVQNDWSDWILDDNLKPVEPMDKEKRLRNNISIDPKDIPTKKLTKDEREAFEALFTSI